jgi:hypothetical protein
MEGTCGTFIKLEKGTQNGQLTEEKIYKMNEVKGCFIHACIAHRMPRPSICWPSHIYQTCLLRPLAVGFMQLASEECACTWSGSGVV